MRAVIGIVALAALLAGVADIISENYFAPDLRHSVTIRKGNFLGHERCVRTDRPDSVNILLGFNE